MERSEKEILLTEYNEESVAIRNFIFSIKRLRHSIEYLKESQVFSICLEFIILLIVCIPSILIGVLFLNQYGTIKTICVLLIIQGLCGVFVVIVHLYAVISEINGFIKRLANYATVFRFIWFIRIHIWLFDYQDSYEYGSWSGTFYLWILLIILAEYIIRISFLCMRRIDCFITFPWLEKKLQSLKNSQQII